MSWSDVGVLRPNEVEPEMTLMINVPFLRTSCSVCVISYLICHTTSWTGSLPELRRGLPSTDCLLRQIQRARRIQLAYPYFPFSALRMISSSFLPLCFVRVFSVDTEILAVRLVSSIFVDRSITVYRIEICQNLFASRFALLFGMELDVVKRNSATAALMISTSIKSKVQNKYPFHKKNLARKYSKRG